MPHDNKHDSRHARIQHELMVTIADARFSAALPPLSDQGWLNLLGRRGETPSQCVKRVADNDRLEFFGDALMYATIGHQLCRQLPNGTPGLYTNIRAALHSNATFAFLAQKLDILAVSEPVMRALTARTFGEAYDGPLSHDRKAIKITADLFETLIAAYYLECGYESLLAWVEGLYRPLISAAYEAYNAWPTGTASHKHSPATCGNPAQGASARQPQRDMHSLPLKPQVPLANTAYIAPAPRPTIPAYILGPGAGTKFGIPSPAARKPTTTAQPQPPKPRAAQVFIDLTLDDDDDNALRSSSFSPPGLSASVALPTLSIPQLPSPSSASSDGDVRPASQTSMTLSLGPGSHDLVVSDTDSDDDSTSGNSESRVTTILLRDSPMDLDEPEDEYGERSMDLGTEYVDQSDEEFAWDETGELFVVA